MKKFHPFSVLLAILFLTPLSHAQKQERSAPPQPDFPPTLPGGKLITTDTSKDFLTPPDTLREGVSIAKTPPTVDFLYYPGQTYPGAPWANWGDSLAAPDGKYYASISDHLALGVKGDGSHGNGTALIFEYSQGTGPSRPHRSPKLRLLANTTEVLDLPKNHYAPGKVHGRLDLGSDGWLYYATHRGSEKATTDANHYQGDWIFRTHPASGKTEVLAHGPVPHHAMPTSILDPERLIFYAGTAPGLNAESKDIQFLAFDTKKRKVIYSGPGGPGRYLMFANSTGRVYYTAGKDGIRDGATLMRFHPDENKARPKKVKDDAPGLRAATRETPNRKIYAVSQAPKGSDSTLWSFDTETEAITILGPAPAASQTYVASLDIDPTGRFLYYVPGAHGSSDKDNGAVIQFDTLTKTKKVIAFLHPFYQKKYGATLKGTYSTALSPEGDKLYITWNVNRGSKAWDSCALTVIHIPYLERLPKP